MCSADQIHLGLTAGKSSSESTKSQINVPLRFRCYPYPPYVMYPTIQAPCRARNTCTYEIYTHTHRQTHTHRHANTRSSSLGCLLSGGRRNAEKTHTHANKHTRRHASSLSSRELLFTQKNNQMELQCVGNFSRGTIGAVWSPSSQKIPTIFFFAFAFCKLLEHRRMSTLHVHRIQVYYTNLYIRDVVLQYIYRYLYETPH